MTTSTGDQKDMQNLSLLDIIGRRAFPVPWEEGEKIPWHDPDFSRRMLKEHLSQAHDLASRRSEIIDRHVAWIHGSLLETRPSSILDLGCGPGLYTSRLAGLGHQCRGIDYSPASVEYALLQAEKQGLSCQYARDDVRQAEYGAGFDLVMMVFGEFNVFAPEDARVILGKARDALSEGGMLLLEPHTHAMVQALGEAPSTWYSEGSGLFSERPHFCLQENHWDSEAQVATTRYFIVDGATSQVTPHAASVQAYHEEEYKSLLEQCGFSEVRMGPSLTGDAEGVHEGLLVITARKKRVQETGTRKGCGQQ